MTNKRPLVRSYGNENWEFDEHGLMRLRIASINDLPMRRASASTAAARPPPRRSSGTERPRPLRRQCGRHARAIPATSPSRRRSRHCRPARFAPLLRRMEERGSWETASRPDLGRFHRGADERLPRHRKQRRQPYIQHRGGPAGFLRVLDDRTFGFVDFSGNGNTSRRAISRTIRRPISS